MFLNGMTRHGVFREHSWEELTIFFSYFSVSNWLTKNTHQNRLRAIENGCGGYITHVDNSNAKLLWLYFGYTQPIRTLYWLKTSNNVSNYWDCNFTHIK